MVITSLPIIIPLFGAFTGTFGGLFTGWIVRRAAPAWSGISLRWVAAGWAAAWAIGLVSIVLVAPFARGIAVEATSVALGASVIGGIGGGVTFWQINKAQRLAAPKLPRA